MKIRWNILAILLLCFTLVSCNGDNDDYVDQIVVRANPFGAAGYTAYVQLSGRDLQVDWGDGSRPDVMLNGDRVDFRHTYPNQNRRYIITIKGRYITLLAIGESNGGGGYYNTMADMVDVTLAPYLRVLDCANNPVAYLDLRRNEVLQYLYCDGTELSALNASYNPNLVEVDCSYSRMSTYAYNDFLNSLHPYPIRGKAVFIGRSDPNYRTANFNIATAKGWYIDPY